jgi:hypothetical protein
VCADIVRRSDIFFAKVGGMGGGGLNVLIYIRFLIGVVVLCYKLAVLKVIPVQKYILILMSEDLVTR